MNGWGTSEIMAAESRHGSGVYHKRPLAIARGEGTWLWDEAGRAYLDFTSGIGVALLGHAHPAVTTAIRTQAGRLVTCPEIFHQRQRAALMGALAAHLPPALDRFFFCNSGSEAVEGALKFARLATGRAEIVATMRGFHGRTMGALSTTWSPRYRTPFEPLLAGVRHVPFDDLAAAGAVIGVETAAVIVEVVQGEGGVHPGRAAYFQGLRRLCDERGAMLIFDEVQSGFGRTGRWFALEHVGVTPDLLCLGKGMAGGVPMGAVVLGPRAGTPPAGSHGSTFGGNPLACAAALATIGTIDAEGLVAQAADLGETLVARLRALEAPVVRQVRGRGLMIGIDLRVRAGPVLQRITEAGLLALPAGRTVLRLLPPLTVSEPELDLALDILTGALAPAAVAL